MENNKKIGVTPNFWGVGYGNSGLLDLTNIVQSIARHDQIFYAQVTLGKALSWDLKRKSYTSARSTLN